MFIAVKVRLFRTYCVCFYDTALWSNLHLIDFRLAILNVSNVFADIQSTVALQKCYLILDFPVLALWYTTLNSKVSFASTLSVCDNDIVRRVLWVCFVSFSLSLCVCSFFCICMCYVYVYGPQLSEKINEWMNEWIWKKMQTNRIYSARF